MNNMKATMKGLLAGSLMVSAMFLSSSCQKDGMDEGNAQYASILSVMNDGTSSLIEANLKSALIETAPLTDKELAALIKMKEEEKLARDVYTALHKKWNSNIFLNISTAENNHLNAIVTLLDNYSTGNGTIAEAGVFTDSEVQALYSKLVEQGSVSLAEAFKVGALIEEMDIKDLLESIEGSSNENLNMVFENLLKGSRNHLRAFNKQLSNLGIVYTPVYISSESYNQIVNSPIEKGKQYNMNGNSKNKNQGKGKGKGQKKGKGKN